MAAKCLVFAYGLLKPGSPNAPRTVSDARPDRVRGRLVSLGEYQGLVEPGTAATWVDGITMEIDADELPALDEFEDVESGEYKRQIIETESGAVAWVYVYQGPG